MYLMIFDDGNKLTNSEFSEEDRECVEEGILEVIDISNPEKPKEFYNGEWRDIANEQN